MERRNNYLIQAGQAKERFLSYDGEKIIRKLGIRADEGYLYVTMIGKCYRIDRKTGEIESEREEKWENDLGYQEVMTLLDFVCDSREGRFLTGKWKNMQSFGLLFHQNLLENEKDPWAERFQKELPRFQKACERLGGRKLENGDAAYAIELFDGLEIGVQLWLGDEEFPPNLRFLWDENALQYIRYETMYFAKELLLERIGEEMAKKTSK